MSTSYFYFALILVPVAALLGDFLYIVVQRWFFPYEYQIIQEIYKDEARSNAISELPKEVSKHSGLAFESPGYESFFASQLGKNVPPKAWDVVRRASMKFKGNPK